MCEITCKCCLCFPPVYIYSLSGIPGPGIVFPRNFSCVYRCGIPCFSIQYFSPDRIKPDIVCRESARQQGHTGPGGPCSGFMLFSSVLGHQGIRNAKSKFLASKYPDKVEVKVKGRHLWKPVKFCCSKVSSITPTQRSGLRRCWGNEETQVVTFSTCWR